MKVRGVWNEEEGMWRMLRKGTGEVNYSEGVCVGMLGMKDGDRCKEELRKDLRPEVRAGEGEIEGKREGRNERR